MKRSALVFVALLVSCAAPSAERAAPAARPDDANDSVGATSVTITLRNHDGTPASAGHVRVTGGRVISPNGNGTASLELDSGRLYEATLSSPGHRSTNVALLPAGAPLTVVATLGTPAHLSEPDTVNLKIYEKRGERYSLTQTLEMKPQKNGTYTKEVNVDGELVFDVAGLSENDVIDPGATLRYDGHGSYLMVSAGSGTRTVTFDPKDLLPSAAKPSVRVEGTATASGVAALSLELIDYREALRHAQKKRKAGSLLGDDAPTVSGWRKKIQDRLLANPSQQIRQALLVAYFSISPWWSADQGASKELQTERWRAEAFENIPMKSPLWGLNPLALREIAEHASQAYVAKFIETASDQELAAQVAFRELQEATWRKKAVLQRRYFAMLDGELKETETGRDFQRNKIKYDPDAQLKEGQPVPAFDVPALSGDKRVTPATYAGKFFLIELWGTWCKPCVADMPALHEMYKKLSPKGLHMLSIALGDTPKKVRDFRKDKHPMPWDHAVVEGDDVDALLGMFSSIGVPAYILVRPDGTVAALGMDFRGEALEKMIAAHMNRPR